GVVIELGRKVRAPADEEHGVNTYSALCGPRAAVLAWLGAMLATAACATLAGARVGFTAPVASGLAVLLLTAGWVAWRYVAGPTTSRAKLVETVSGVWTLVLYLSVGAAPLLWRWWSAPGGGG